MSDSKYSDLPTVSIPESTDQWGVNQGGISKSITTTQIIGGTVQGSIPFVGSAATLVQDSSNFFFDSAATRLGVGTNAPEGTIHISSGVPSAVNPTSQAKDAIFQSDGDAGVTIFSPDANVSSLVLGSPGGVGNEGARIRWSNSIGLLSIATTEAGAEIRIAPGFLNTAMTLTSTGGVTQVAIGINAAISSAKLHVASATQGFLEPKWTDAQETTNVAGLGTTDDGLQWFNSTSKQWKGWDGSAVVIIG